MFRSHATARPCRPADGRPVPARCMPHSGREYTSSTGLPGADSAAGGNPARENRLQSMLIKQRSTER